MPPRARRYDEERLRAALAASGHPDAAGVAAAALPDALIRAVAARLAAGEPVGSEPVRVASRVAADALAARAPGRSVEVRVTDPVHRVGVAVQCVAGPRHTRGTPPGVVEVTDAATWLALVTGALPWTEAVASGRVAASGERADLTALLPL